ncbi:MAG TPA: UDP-3-O-(3-hydroxymyristoyl)glucosamine N-acyltransferase, partial [Gemmatimonadales bacterium]|nr:UDP-3-O-(3-hydroxymyristoyl)glucosamine N-acyltransferase [Gemmatimonadales bacterium]
SRAGCVLVPPALVDQAGGPAIRIVVDHPQQALQLVVARLHPSLPHAPGVHPTAVIGTGTQLGADAAVGPRVVIGIGCRLGDRVTLGPGAVLEDGVELGDDTVVGPQVTICTGTVLGSRVMVKAGAVIGGTGFGYISGVGGHRRIPHVGGCRIGDDVDIGSNTCIDRGSLGDTVIGRGCKLDNLVHVAHNVRLGEDCLLMAGAMIAGSTRVGNRVVLAGQAGMIGHLEIGDDVRVAAQAGVISSLEAGQEVSGFPARPHSDFLRAVAAMYRLAPFARRLESLAKADAGA